MYVCPLDTDVVLVSQCTEVHISTIVLHNPVGSQNSIFRPVINHQPLSTSRTSTLLERL